MFLQAPTSKAVSRELQSMPNWVREEAVGNQTAKWWQYPMAVKCVCGVCQSVEHELTLVSEITNYYA